jgi:hypothetical protein
MIPLQIPETCALVGLTFPADENEYRRRWTAFSSGEEYDAQKGEAKKKFLSEVSKFQRLGFDYAQSWASALSSEPGRTFYQNWTGGSAEKRVAEKAVTLSNEQRDSERKFQALLYSRAMEFPNEEYSDRFAAVATSDNGEKLLAGMKKTESTFVNDRHGAPLQVPSQDTRMQRATKEEASETTEKHNPQLEAQSKQAFKDLVERLAFEAGANKDGVSLWARDHHPEARKLYITWKHQEHLGSKEALLRRQQQRSPNA